jgi:hypothetical protein
MSYCFVLQATMDCLALTLNYEKSDVLDVTDLESAKTRIKYLRDRLLLEETEFLGLKSSFETESSRASKLENELATMKLKVSVLESKLKKISENS